MREKKQNTKTFVGVIAVSVLVVTVIAILAVFGGERRRGEGIVLPTQGQNQPPSTEALSGAGFVTLTPENTPEVVRTLKRPSCYHQTLSAVIPTDANASQTQIELWVRENVWKIVRRDAIGTRCILTDGQRAYLWYTDDVYSMSSVRLPDGVTRDELAGIVTYETLAATDPKHILEVAYLPAHAESDLYCLSVKTDVDGERAAYQIDLTTGLLYGAELQRDGESTYSVRQTALELLSSDDESLLDEMQLPVGTANFSAEKETPQA